MKQREAIDTTISALGDRVLPAHDALLALCRGLADELDAGDAEERGRAALWREYRAAVGALVELGADGGDDDGQAALVDRLSSPVGDAKDAKPANARARNRSGGGKRRAPADAVAAAGRGRRRGTAG